MKKIMMIAAMMVATISANAQFEQGTFSIQPKAGGNAAWLSNMPNLNLDLVGGVTLDKAPAAGGIVGVEAEYMLTDNFSLAAGLTYGEQGGGYEDYEYNYGGAKVEIKDLKYEMDYLNIPVVANYYLFRGFAVKAGVQFGFLTSAKTKSKMKMVSSAGGQTITFDLEEKTIGNQDFKDTLEKFDLSIPMGVSYEFKVPIVIDLRYNLGLTKVGKESVSFMKDCKNNVVSLTVGYKFAL
jgi:hypothetical protein